MHGGEWDSGKHIAGTEMNVELAAVEDAGTIIEAEDVVGGQVTVTVAHLPVRDASGEQRTPALKIATRERGDAASRATAGTAGAVQGARTMGGGAPQSAGH